VVTLKQKFQPLVSGIGSEPCTRSAMAVLPSAVLFLTSIPPLTRAFTAATVISSLIYAWLCWSNGPDNTIPYLTLVPGSSLFYPWTLATSALVEISVFEFIATILVIPPSLRYLERLWGSIETLKFILVSIVVPNIIALVFNWLEFIVTRNADLFLYGMQYHGQMALQTAILVAFTQIIPEHQVQVLGIIKARVKSLPMAYLTFSTVMTFIGFQCPFIIIQFGWLVSWIYLRFYKKNIGDTIGGESYGDRSETFAFVYWFPPFIHYPISLLSNSVHSTATRFHLIPLPGTDIETGSYSQLPGGARAEAERRRAMALKALDQRIANSSPISTHQGNATLQSPRLPPAAASRSDGPTTGSMPAARANERTKSIDLGDSRSDNR